MSRYMAFLYNTGSRGQVVDTVASHVMNNLHVRASANMLRTKYDDIT